jgi:hypothetical protein
MSQNKKNQLLQKNISKDHDFHSFRFVLLNPASHPFSLSFL